MEPTGLGTLDPNVLPLDAFELSGSEADSERLIGLKSPWKWDSEDGSYPISGYVAGRGWWQKHADGTLVQWGTGAISGALSVTAFLHTIATATGSFLLPIPFVDATYTTTGSARLNTNSNLVGTVGFMPASASMVYFREQWPFDYSGSGRTIEWVAIGRWKA